MDKSLVKVLHFGHLLSITMVPKPPINGDVLLIHKTLFHLFLMQWDTTDNHWLWYVIGSLFFTSCREINRCILSLLIFGNDHSCRVICSNYRHCSTAYTIMTGTLWSMEFRLSLFWYVSIRLYSNSALTVVVCQVMLILKIPKPFHVQDKLLQMYKTADLQGEHQTYFISTRKQP